MKSGHLTLHDEIILVQEYTVETHFIVYFIFTTQKFTKSKTKIKISSNDRKMGMEGGLDSTNEHDILRQVVILICVLCVLCSITGGCCGLADD